MLRDYHVVDVEIPGQYFTDQVWLLLFFFISEIFYLVFMFLYYLFIFSLCQKKKRKLSGKSLKLEVSYDLVLNI